MLHLWQAFVAWMIVHGDTAMAVVGVLFAYSLIPTVIQAVRVGKTDIALQTSAITFGCMVVTELFYLSMRPHPMLWAFSTSAVTTVCWGILMVVRIRQPKTRMSVWEYWQHCRGMGARWLDLPRELWKLRVKEYRDFWLSKKWLSPRHCSECGGTFIPDDPTRTECGYTCQLIANGCGPDGF